MDEPIAVLLIMLVIVVAILGFAYLPGYESGIAVGKCQLAEELGYASRIGPTGHCEIFEDSEWKNYEEVLGIKNERE